jgi:hypothetical protein
MSQRSAVPVAAAAVVVVVVGAVAEDAIAIAVAAAAVGEFLDRRADTVGVVGARGGLGQ